MSKKNGYEVVARPEAWNTRRASWPYDEIVATAATGKALRIHMRGQKYQNVQGTLSASIGRRGFRLRTKQDGDHVIVWAEKR